MVDAGRYQGFPDRYSRAATGLGQGLRRSRLGSDLAYIDRPLVTGFDKLSPHVRLGPRSSTGRPVTVYIDPPTWPGHGHLWSHLISDRSYQELHDFAARLGIPRRGFERDHYDVIAERYGAALAAGAQPVSSREIVVLLTAAGLRRRRLSRLAPRPATE